jgi:AraC-like DNA-binding protein
MALCERVESAPEEEYTLAMLAQSAALSPSRLLHLFREQMGIPLRPYLRWRRLWHSIALIVQGQRLIEAAHDAGFADQAHLSRTARHSLGRSLSEILTEK